jgi:hypothetical protein
MIALHAFINARFLKTMLKESHAVLFVVTTFLTANSQNVTHNHTTTFLAKKGPFTMKMKQI